MTYSDPPATLVDFVTKSYEERRLQRYLDEQNQVDNASESELFEDADRYDWNYHNNGNQLNREQQDSNDDPERQSFFLPLILLVALHITYPIYLYFMETKSTLT